MPPSPTTDSDRPWRWHPERTRVKLRIRLTPNASRDRLGTLVATAQGCAIAAHVRAVPENGRANRALETLIAKWLRLPKSSVTLTNGATSRIKTVTLEPLVTAEADRLQTAFAHLEAC